MQYGNTLLRTLLTGLLLAAMLTCTREVGVIHFEQQESGTLRLTHQVISLEILPSTRIVVRYRSDDGEELSLVTTDPDHSPATHLPTIDGQAVDQFVLQPESVRFETVRDMHGEGKGLTVRAQAQGPRNSLIEKVLQINLYERYPDAAIVNTSYLVLEADAPLRLDEVTSDAFRLDRRRVAPGEEAYDFWGFFGYGKIVPGSHGHRRANVLPVTADLQLRNDSELISGVPLMDIWAPEMGMAIASVEKRAHIIKMPAAVDEEGLVNISLLQQPRQTLSAGDSYTALETAIIVHKLDYATPLMRYASLMADRGITPKPCPQFGYDPFWCNWGYKRDWQLSHGLDRLEAFQELGIKSVTVDDGWFDNFGDWEVSLAKFPDGERQFIEWVDRFHENGLRAVIWWVPGIAGPELARQHPDWLVLDAEGNPVPSHWRNALMLCPTVPEVLHFHEDLTEKFITEYGFDGFKLDGIYVAPRCYNPGHNHNSPDDSYAAYEDIFRVIYKRVKELKPKGDFILGQCPCGALASPYYLQWGNRPVTADPPHMTISTRYRVKTYKALLGPTACVDNDFHERYNDYFPVEVGCGGLVTTKYTVLSDYEYGQFKKWYGLYNQHRLSSGEYLQLYDVGHDTPETYAVRKGESYYYTFLKPGINGPEGVPWFEHEVEQRAEMLRRFEHKLGELPLWQGKVELRGLENRLYTAYNIESGETLGSVHGPTGDLEITFRDHLIIRLDPG
ncbi:MAG: alpha-galactosidase [Fidelibacterota bacterium]|nr:MAG: alpha-galactosidase [Candidatus Neomarinimicrobiota bacterium]